MSRPALEVADIFRDHGAAWRRATAGHVSLDQLKVMSAIERCRTAALGGHVARCEDCTHTVIAYNSCRNRHCPKCQAAAAAEWLAAREADLLPVAYFHVVFTLPAAIADIAYQNKAAIYDILFTASAETMIAIAADPKHLGARIGITAVLHTWGSAMTHHPHVHMIVPGGGISADGSRWVSCRPNFFLPVPVLSRLFRGLFLAKLRAAHQTGRLKFFGVHAHLDDARAFKAYLAANPVAQCTVRSFTPARAPILRGKATASTAAVKPPSRQIPIALAQPSVPHSPRFRALALFGRRPQERVHGLGIPASENLHTSGPSRAHRCATGVDPTATFGAGRQRPGHGDEAAIAPRPVGSAASRPSRPLIKGDTLPRSGHSS
jgi:hypothetical protein